MSCAQSLEGYMAGYRAAFERFDSDHDGMLTLAEMESSLRYLGHDIAAAQLQQHTGGAIDFSSFVQIAERSRPAQPDPIRQAWDLFDADHDGVITLQELKVALVKIGEFLPPGEAERMHYSVDLDHDGTISFSEFQAMMARQHPQ